MPTFLTSSWDELWIGTRFDTCPWNNAERIDFREGPSAKSFLAGVQGELFGMSKLRDLAGGYSILHRMSDHDVLEQVAEDLEFGSLRAYRLPRPAIHFSFPKAPSVAEPSPPPPIVQVPRTSFVVELSSDEGWPIPAATYRVTFLKTGEDRTGKLGADGKATLYDVPAGQAMVAYPDAEDVSAKALAVAARRALDGRDYGPVYRLLQETPSTIQAAIAAYDQYFNDYTGRGFVNDMDAAFTDPDAQEVVRSLLVKAGVVTHSPSPPIRFEWREQDE